MQLSSFLQNGYGDFRRGTWKKNKGHFRTLADGQSPRAMVIACSDSRVDPAIIFNAGPGDLFIVRNVANVVPPFAAGQYGASAALEYAVTALRVTDILIMGHSGCGGIKACLDSHAGDEAGESCVGRWIAALAPARARVLEAHGEAARADQLHALELEGVRQSIQNMQEFPFVQERMADRSLSVHGGYFDIGSATLYAMDGDTQEFLPMPGR